MGSEMDVADRWAVLSVAHKRAWRYAPLRTAEYRLPDVIGGRKRARNRAFRVAVARGQLNDLGHRPCSESYPCVLHQMPPSPWLTGVLSCGRPAKPQPSGDSGAFNCQAPLDGSGGAGGGLQVGEGR